MHIEQDDHFLARKAELQELARALKIDPLYMTIADLREEITRRLGISFKWMRLC